MYGLPDQEWADLVLSVNTHRSQRRLSPSEVADLMARAVRQTSTEGLAKSLGFAGSDMVKRFLSLHRLDADLRDMVDWGAGPGTVSMTAAVILATLPDSDTIRTAFQAAMKHDLTKEEARQVKQTFSRGLGPIDECVRSVLKTRPRVERREVILGAVGVPSLRERLARLTPSQRNEALRAVLADLFPDVAFAGSNLTRSFFSLVLREDQALKLRSGLGGESLEELVGQGLGRWVERGD